MKLKVLLAASIAALAAFPAHAVTVVLDSVTAEGPYTRYTYGGIYLSGANGGPAEGLDNSSTFILYDFAGYVAGSALSAFPQITASEEYVSSSSLLPTGAFDDPTKLNVVFTWTAGGLDIPAPDVLLSGLSALSIYSGIDPSSQAFGALTVKLGNNTPLETRGFAAGPTAVPEPATWGMLLLGFSMVGIATRRRRAMRSVLA